MKILLSPTYWPDAAPLALSASGNTLTINGEAFDFSAVHDGGTLPREAIDCAMIAGDVTRCEGELHVPLLLPYGENAPEAVRFPAPLSVTQDGPIALPYDLEVTP